MMKLPAEAKLGLIGCGIQYSLSPFIHRLAAAKLGLSHSYELFDLSTSELTPFLEHFFKLICRPEGYFR